MTSTTSASARVNTNTILKHFLKKSLNGDLFVRELNYIGLLNRKTGLIDVDTFLYHLPPLCSFHIVSEPLIHMY